MGIRCCSSYQGSLFKFFSFFGLENESAKFANGKWSWILGNYCTNYSETSKLLWSIQPFNLKNEISLYSHLKPFSFAFVFANHADFAVSMNDLMMSWNVYRAEIFVQQKLRSMHESESSKFWCAKEQIHSWERSRNVWMTSGTRNVRRFLQVGGAYNTNTNTHASRTFPRQKIFDFHLWLWIFHFPTFLDFPQKFSSTNCVIHASILIRHYRIGINLK